MKVQRIGRISQAHHYSIPPDRTACLRLIMLLGGERWDMQVHPTFQVEGNKEAIIFVDHSNGVINKNNRFFA